MTRNLYLGADLTPALQGPDVDGAVDAAYQIEQQVHRTKFPSVRAALLAKEIQKAKPDIVGLQEAAWWRTGPYDLTAALTDGPKATQTDPQGGDFLTDLLAQLNKGGKKGKKGSAARQEEEQAAAVQDRRRQAGVRLRAAGQPGLWRTRWLPGPVPQRAPDHARRDPGPQGRQDQQRDQRHVQHAAARQGRRSRQRRRDPRLGRSRREGQRRKVHVVDSHFEAFDSAASNTASDGKTYPKGGIREAQAKQLIAPAVRRARSCRPFCSATSTPIHRYTATRWTRATRCAYRALLAGGWSERAFTPPPFGCCIEDSNLNDPSTAGITHRVDHVMSNNKKIKFKKGGLTTTYANGLWSSDHFGVWSRLQVK